MHKYFVPIRGYRLSVRTVLLTFVWPCACYFDMWLRGDVGPLRKLYIFIQCFLLSFALGFFRKSCFSRVAFDRACHMLGRRDPHPRPPQPRRSAQNECSLKQPKRKINFETFFKARMWGIVGRTVSVSIGWAYRTAFRVNASVKHNRCDLVYFRCLRMARLSASRFGP